MVIGQGSKQEKLDEAQVTELCAAAFAQKNLNDKRLLVIIPDHTRTSPIDMMFRVVYELLANRVKILDFLIASGTHPPMSEKAINIRVGISPQNRKTRYSKARFYNHFWQDPNQLTKIGTIYEEDVAQITGRMMNERVEVTINKMVFDYDLLLIIGPTFPHEVAGFSGGNKYLFPGISGQEIIDMFHWLGALITNPAIIGTEDTPVRKIINKAASMLPMERLCMSLVVKGDDLAGLYIGSPEEAFSAAADLSSRIHIVYKDRTFDRVLSCAPRMYDDIWTAGKCMYKLEPIVADNGELIIYAPHITQISATHGEVIEKIGYHVRDYFVSQMDKFKDTPGGIMAHSTHVKGIGTFENAAEKPRVNVVLATQIPRETCENINLGYRDPKTININEWENRENEGILYVPKAGEVLYRLQEKPQMGEM